MASASQLDITTSPDNLATGSQIFAAACDDAVDVTYTTGGTVTAPTYTGFVISNINDACFAPTAKGLSWSLGYQTWNSGSSSYNAVATLATASPGTIVDNGEVGTGLADNNTVTVTFATTSLGDVILGSTKLVDIAITIS